MTEVENFFKRYDKTPLSVNLATLVAHGSVRAKVMGSENRDPTPEELKKMEELVDQAMKDGAVGLSTGLKPAPMSNTEPGPRVA